MLRPLLQLFIYLAKVAPDPYLLNAASDELVRLAQRVAVFEARELRLERADGKEGYVQQLRELRDTPFELVIGWARLHQGCPDQGVGRQT